MIRGTDLIILFTSLVPNTINLFARWGAQIGKATFRMRGKFHSFFPRFLYTGCRNSPRACSPYQFLHVPKSPSPITGPTCVTGVGETRAWRKSSLSARLVFVHGERKFRFRGDALRASAYQESRWNSPSNSGKNSILFAARPSDSSDRWIPAGAGDSIRGKRNENRAAARSTALYGHPCGPCSSFYSSYFCESAVAILYIKPPGGMPFSPIELQRRVTV